MSNYLAIATVTAALSRVLQAAIGIDVPGAVATTVRPNGPSSGVPDIGVNIFLYQSTPNTSWRNHDLPTRRPDSTMAQRPQMAIDLHYLLSFYGDEATLEPQRLLGSTLRTLHTKPILTRQDIQNTVTAIDFLNDSNLAEAVESVKFILIPLNLQALVCLFPNYLCSFSGLSGFSGTDLDGPATDYGTAGAGAHYSRAAIDRLGGLVGSGARYPRQPATLASGRC